MASSERRQQLLDSLFENFQTAGLEIRAWAILPNHYHLLAYVPDFALLTNIFRHVHGATSRYWNLSDCQQGRKVWCSFTDRAIRSERHYYTTLNYLHYNPVKHGWVASPYDWVESSVHWYLEFLGREWLRDQWNLHPTRDYGQGWDDLQDLHSGQ
jgi:putative transposase